MLQTSSDIKLPDSTSEKQPKDRLVISVSAEDVIVAGRPVAQVTAVMGVKSNVIPGLQKELLHQASRKAEVPEGGFEVTIMGDREIPYWLLKKIMLTCQATDFARISLAVNRLTPEPADEGQTS